MNNTDSFEHILADAVVLLTKIVADLTDSEDAMDQRAAFVIAAQAADLCDRAIALGAE